MAEKICPGKTGIDNCVTRVKKLIKNINTLYFYQ